ncbi:hypothetical protein J2X83_004699 [Brevibacillus nitrificans]|nr:hypothetical protein [Brevibacillus nitrificans]
MTQRKGSFWIANATLETGFAWKDGRVSGTRTDT